MTADTPTLRLERVAQGPVFVHGWIVTDDHRSCVSLPPAAFAALESALDGSWAERFLEQRDEAIAERDRLRARVGADTRWKVGDRVVKTGGDYTYTGTVVAAFAKLSGQTRYVVEDERGLLFIFNGGQLTLAPTATSPIPRFCPECGPGCHHTPPAPADIVIAGDQILGAHAPTTPDGAPC